MPKAPGAKRAAPGTAASLNNIVSGLGGMEKSLIRDLANKGALSYPNLKRDQQEAYDSNVVSQNLTKLIDKNLVQQISSVDKVKRFNLTALGREVHRAIGPRG